MININLSGDTIPFFQSLNTYNMPSMSGAVQWNGMYKHFEVSTGGGWQKIENNINLNMSSDFEEVMKWAKNKMKEEKEILELSKKYPAIANAKDHLDNMIKLVKGE
jgi:hypothetical protein